MQLIKHELINILTEFKGRKTSLQINDKMLKA